MKIPDDFGIKKEKKHSEFIELSGKAIRNIFLCSLGVLIIVTGVMFGPWENLKTSVINTEGSKQAEFLEELQAMNMTLRAIQQKDSTVKSGHEYLLVKNVPGTNPFVINENTCANGARLIVRLREEFRETKKIKDATILVTGIAAAKNRGAFNAEVAVNNIVPVQMRNLPNDMIMENETVFIAYKISAGENAQKLEYKLECY